MDIVVISDNNNPVRRNNVVKIFEEKHVKFHFFNAIMANRMSEKEIAKVAVEHTFLSASEIGCALSHRTVYDDFLQSEHKSLVVCEDDICFTQDFSADIVADVVDFVEESDEPRLVVLQKSIYHHKRVKNLDKGICIYSTRNAFLAHGYVLNRTAADNISRIQRPIRFEIDAFKFYYWLDACKLYCLDKDFILQHDIDVCSQTVIKNWASDRGKKKKRAYNLIYKNLSFKGKCISQWRRFEKALYKSSEGLDY